jgi:hypothetical protein
MVCIGRRPRGLPLEPPARPAVGQSRVPHALGPTGYPLLAACRVARAGCFSARQASLQVSPQSWCTDVSTSAAHRTSPGTCRWPGRAVSSFWWTRRGTVQESPAWLRRSSPPLIATPLAVLGPIRRPERLVAPGSRRRAEGRESSVRQPGSRGDPRRGRVGAQ